MKHKILLAALLPLALLAQFTAESRLVNLSVLVRDPQSRQPIPDLTANSFRLLVDGKERPITHFHPEGETRRPLALMIYLNLAPGGALRQLSQPAAILSLTQALKRLAPEDEVAVFATVDWFAGKPKLISVLGQNRQASAQAIADAVTAERRNESGSRDRSLSLAVDHAKSLATQRPGSHVALVYISDGMNTLDTIEARDRKALATALEADDISCSALTVDMLGSYAAAAAVLNPLGKAFGYSFTGSGKYLAQQSGGVVVEVACLADLGRGLSEVTGTYASRYTLGFQPGDRRGFHKLELQLVDKAHKRLIISTRRGFRS